jgi:scyllo-inositol 2-dehydrogenase (NADP+)
MNPTRLGVVGLGLIWERVHQPNLENLKDVFEAIAFCDVDEQRRAAIADKFPEAYVLSNYQDLLKLSQVDAVLILTPISLNESMALAALQAGKDVIMEKPIARTTAKGIALVDTARQAGRRLFVTEQMGYRKAEDTLIGLLAAGEIGEVVMWDRVQHRVLAKLPERMNYTTTPWRQNPDYPLGDLLDGGIHLIASVTKVFGAPVTIFAAGSRKFRPGYGEYDQVTMMFQYHNGLVGMLSHSDCLFEAQNHFHIHGNGGIISWTPDRIVIQKPGRPEQTIVLPAENPYANMWQALARAWQENSEPYYSPEKALRDLMVVEMVAHSIKSGQRAEAVKSDLISD